MVQRRYFQGSGGRLPEELGTFDGHREPKVRDESALPPPAGWRCPVGSSGGTEPFPWFCAGPPVLACSRTLVIHQNAPSSCAGQLLWQRHCTKPEGNMLYSKEGGHPNSNCAPMGPG